MTITHPSILLIDDDPYMHDMFGLILESSPFQLVSRWDAQAGLDYLSQHLPDVIITDLILPDSDGYRVLEQIRKNPATHDTKVILTTTYLEQRAAPEIVARGFDGFLPKPLSPLKVVPYIESILQGNLSGRA